MEHKTYKTYTIKYMSISGNAHIYHLGRYIKGFFGKGKIEGEALAKNHIDIIIKERA